MRSNLLYPAGGSTTTPLSACRAVSCEAVHTAKSVSKPAMSSIGTKRKLPPPPGSPGYDAARGKGQGARAPNSTTTGRGGRGRGRGSGRGGGRGRGGRGGRGAGAARVRGERDMDRQLGQDAPPPESLHKYVRGPGNSTAVSELVVRHEIRLSCTKALRVPAHRSVLDS